MLLVIHPLTGERVPIWVGNFVIASYGTGAVMAVPGHDERDFDFAKKYGIPIKRVLVMKEDIAADSELKSAEVDLGVDGKTLDWMVLTDYMGQKLNLLFVNYSKKKEWAREQ